MSKKHNFKKVNLLKVFNLSSTKISVITISVIGLFVLINALIAPFFFRLDLSKGQAYTLSDATRNIVRNIDKEVKVGFYVSSDLPTRLVPLRNEVTDLLQEYKKAGGSKVSLRILDPKKDGNALKEAQEVGIPELQFSQIEQDKYAVTTSYFGIAIQQGDKREVLPQVTDIESLEYNVTAAMYKLTRKESPKVAIAGHEPDPNGGDPIGTLRAVLSQQFEVETVNIASDAATSIDPAYKTLVVFDTGVPAKTDMITEYLNKGGKVVVFVDGVTVMDNLTTTPSQHGLETVLAEWGIGLNKNLVLSMASELVNFGNQMVSYLVPYPFWVKTDEFNRSSSFFSNINQLTFPWVSSLTVQKKEGIKTEMLVQSSKNSWEQKDNFTLNPQSIARPQEKDFKSFTLAAVAKKNNGGTLVVIPSSRFVGEQFLTRTSDNLEFVLNIVNDMASSGALSGIRQRAVSSYPLPDLAESQKDIFRYLSILLLPVLFALYAVVRLVKRK